MKITDALVGEHGALYPLLDEIERAGPREDAEARAQAQLLASTLLGHARAEDELLFAAMEAEGALAGPLAAMRAEHEEIEAALTRAATAPEPGAAAEDLLRAVAVARGHFEKEEQVLFPAAEELLGEAVLVGLGERWAERRLRPPVSFDPP